MTSDYSISIEWHVDDVLEVRPDLTLLEAKEVLEYCKEKHDATVGINWNTLEDVADILFGSRG